MGILLGNLTVEEMESRMGISLNEEDRKSLKEMRQDNAQNIEAGKYHCFDAPQTIVCDDMETANRFYGIMSKYAIKGMWSVSISDKAKESEVK